MSESGSVRHVGPVTALVLHAQHGPDLRPYVDPVFDGKGLVFDSIREYADDVSNLLHEGNFDIMYAVALDYCSESHNPNVLTNALALCSDVAETTAQLPSAPIAASGRYVV